MSGWMCTWTWVRRGYVHAAEAEVVFAVVGVFFFHFLFVVVGGQSAFVLHAFAVAFDHVVGAHVFVGGFLFVLVAPDQCGEDLQRCVDFWRVARVGRVEAEHQQVVEDGTLRSEDDHESVEGRVLGQLADESRLVQQPAVHHDLEANLHAADHEHLQVVCLAPSKAACTWPASSRASAAVRCARRSWASGQPLVPSRRGS